MSRLLISKLLSFIKMDEKIKEWLQDAKSKGYSNNEIKRLLIDRGYSEQAINEIFSSLEKSVTLDKDVRNFANKKVLKVSVGILLIIAIAMLLFYFSDISSVSEIESKDIEAIGIIEMRVSGNIEIRLPELREGKLLASEKVLSKDFHIKFISNGVFIDIHRVLAPSSVIPEDKNIKLKAIEQLGLLEGINEEYNNNYATLNSISKDVFVIWKEQELVVAKGNLLKTESRDRGIAIIEIGNFHDAYAELADETETKKFDVFFKDINENYEVNSHKLSLKLNGKEFSGEEPVKIKERIVNGAVAIIDNKVQGMFFLNNGETYFINSNTLASVIES